MNTGIRYGRCPVPGHLAVELRVRSVLSKADEPRSSVYGRSHRADLRVCDTRLLRRAEISLRRPRHDGSHRHLRAS
jgi:hypothetical protein